MSEAMFDGLGKANDVYDRKFTISMEKRVFLVKDSALPASKLVDYLEVDKFVCLKCLFGTQHLRAGIRRVWRFRRFLWRWWWRRSPWASERGGYFVSGKLSG